MFKTRLLSGIVLVVVLIATVGIGGYLLLGVLGVLSLIGLRELYQTCNVEKSIGITGYFAAALWYLLLITVSARGMMSNVTQYMMPLIIFFLVAVMAVYVFSFPAFRSEQVTMVFFGFLYVAVMLSYVYQTRELPGGNVIVWLIFLSSWGCDTCAYCVGMLLGKHKMAPKLSPKKSVEGGIGGIAGAALLGALFALGANHFVDASANPLHYALICGVGGMISQIGDLAASAIKRNHDIKDYGHLIPGHGGVLDRFDSVIFTAPVIYYLASAFASNII